MAKDLDIRTDVCGYKIFKDGVAVERVSDISRVWRGDLVTFALGCSFSFEHALIDAGLPVRHIDCGCNVPMYKTGIATTPRGRFAGPLVVSMRPRITSYNVCYTKLLRKYQNAWRRRGGGVSLVSHPHRRTAAVNTPWTVSFTSDNIAGASPEVVAAIAACNGGTAKPYGADVYADRARVRLAEVFERVITSYSIHYTKLYDVSGGEASRSTV